MGRFTFALPAAIALAACSGADRAALPEPENLCTAAGARCVTVPARDVVAVDGDTFELQRLTDRGVQQIRLRLIGWDSPESGNAAACLEESDLGVAVEARVQALFAEGDTVAFLPETVDQFGRTRAHVYLDGQHVGWLLSRDGLSRPWGEGDARPNWCE